MSARTLLLLSALTLVLPGCQTVSDPPPAEVDPEQWAAAKAEIYRELALRSLRGGDADRTRRLLAEAVQFESGDIRSLELLARLSLSSGQLVEAKSYALWWLELEPDSVRALCLNGIVEEALGNFEEAEELFRSADRIDTQDPQPLIDLHAFYLNRDQEERAATVRAQALLRFPEAHEVLLDHGAYLESRGRWSEALVSFQKARVLRPEDLDVAVRVGTTALMGGSEAELVALDREMPPHTRLEDTSLALLLTALHLRQGKEEAALQELDLLVGTAAQDPVICLLRGEILLGRRDLMGAEAAFRASLQADERIARAHAGLARVFLARGHQDGATRSLRRAVELDPANAVNRALLAACLAHTGDLAGAKEHLEVARESGQASRLVLEVDRRFPLLAPEAEALKER